MPTKNQKVMNNDSYMNFALAIGTQKDRSARTEIQRASLFSREKLINIYMGDGIARKIVDLPSEEATRSWFSIVGNFDPTKIMKIEDKMRKLGVQQKITDAMRWKRLFGGSAIILGIDDGSNLDQPVNESKVRGLDFLRVVDRYQMTWMPEDQYNDPEDERYGQIRLWTITPITIGMEYKVHESRIIIMDGAALPEIVRHANQMWGMSVVQYCYEHVERMSMAYKHANNLLERAQQAIHKIPKMSDYTKTEKGREAVKARLDLVDMVRSITNTIAIDAEEDYDIRSLSMSGVHEVMDRYSEAVSAVSNIPLPKLMGRTSGGLNSTGAGDLENWYATIRQIQEEDLRGPLEKITYLLVQENTDKWDLKFNPLHTIGEKEQAEIDRINANVADLYVGMGSLDPSEVRDHLRDNSNYPVGAGDVVMDPNSIPEETPAE